MTILPGFLLALGLALFGQWLAGILATAMGLAHGAISGILLAILLGVLVGNLLRLPRALESGIRFSVVRVLRLGIVLLGLRLSLATAGAIGLRSLPVVAVTVTTALVFASWASRRAGLTQRLGTLIAVGTGICGATAIIATAPLIAARDDETSYAIACIALFGMLAMLLYPFAAHALFDGDSLRAGLFLGTAVHDTAQVAGAGLVYQQYFQDPRVLDVATVTKLLRNTSMLAVIPLMAALHHRRTGEGGKASGLAAMVPLFIVAFVAMSLLRTIGDLGDRPFGLLEPGHWQQVISLAGQASTICLAIAMAAVGLGTRLGNLRTIGPKPLAVGLLSAVAVGFVSFAMISLLY